MNNRPTEGICSDCWTSGNPGIGGARVTNLEGEILDSYDTPSNEVHSNNYYELMGVALAVRFALKHGIKTVWVDSKSALAWARDGKPGKSVKVDRIELTARALLIRRRCAKYGIELKKWDTESWGEIPADYGRKVG